MDLINKRNLRREFCINGIICSSAIQFLPTTGKKPQKAKTPDPVLLNCTTEYLKKGNVNAIFAILDYLCFSQMYPFIKGGFCQSLKICISIPFLVTLVTFVSLKQFSGLFSLRELHGKHLVSENFDLN